MNIFGLDLIHYKMKIQFSTIGKTKILKFKHNKMLNKKGKRLLKNLKNFWFLLFSLNFKHF